MCLLPVRSTNSGNESDRQYVAVTFQSADSARMRFRPMKPEAPVTSKFMQWQCGPVFYTTLCFARVLLPTRPLVQIRVVPVRGRYREFACPLRALGAA